MRYLKSGCRVLLASVFTLGLIACSSTTKERRPAFYPNKHYDRAGAEQIEIDVTQCKEKADQFVAQKDHRKQIASTTLKRSAVGTAVGATAGSFSGRAGRGAGIGASTGAILGLVGGMSNASKPDGVYEKFVERCLKDLGYDVIGWQG